MTVQVRGPRGDGRVVVPATIVPFRRLEFSGALAGVLAVAGVVLFAGFTAAQAAETPISVASSSGTATVTVSGSGGDHWHVAVTTKPAGLRVLVQVAGRPSRAGKSPIRVDYACTNCATRVTAKLWPVAGRPVPSAATIRVALYRR